MKIWGHSVVSTQMLISMHRNCAWTTTNTDCYRCVALVSYVTQAVLLQFHNFLKYLTIFDKVLNKTQISLNLHDICVS